MARKTIPKEIKQSVKRFLDCLEKDVPVKSAYVFGSFAKGSPHRWSDIDVCVVSPKFSDAWQAKRRLWRYLPSISDPYQPTIEPVGYSPKDFKEGSILIDEIKKTGIRIK